MIRYRVYLFRFNRESISIHPPDSIATEQNLAFLIHYCLSGCAVLLKSMPEGMCIATYEYY